MTTAQIENADPLFTVDQAAEYLTVGRGTVNYWRHKSIGPRFTRIGKNIRYRQSDLDVYIESRVEDTNRVATG